MPTHCRWSVAVVRFNGHVEAGNGSDFRISQGRRDLAEIVRAHANVAIADHHHFVGGLVHQPRKFGHLVVDGDASRAVEGRECRVLEIRGSVLQ